MNLLFILPDQLGADRLGCYGAEVATPRIDALAEAGVVFNRAYTSSPVCTPYRGVLLSGRYPSETGVNENGIMLPREGFTPLAAALNESGYSTSYVGKWHLSGKPNGNRWVEPDRRGGFADFIGWESHHVDHRRGLIFEEGPRPIEMEGHETDALTDIACRRLRKLAAGAKPFCLFVAYQAPHPPCTPPEGFYPEKSELDAARKPNVPDDPPEYRRPEWGAEYPHAEFLRRYYGEISHLDAAVGRLLDVLDETAPDTIVVFTSDHGEMAGSHGLYGKGVMYEESIHVPLIVRVPGRSPERTDRFFATVDFYSTLLSLLDAAGGGSASRGVDQSSFLIDGEGPRRRLVFVEYHTRCVFDGRYKLVITPTMDEPLGFYALESDPYEMRNRKDDRSEAAEIARLRSALENEFADGENPQDSRR